MELSVKLTSIRKTSIIFELNKMLDNANRVFISWTGQRRVSVNGYCGSVDINEIVKLFLKAAPREDQGTNNLIDRISFYNLWIKVKKICRDEEHLKATKIYKFLVPLKESCYEQCRCGVKSLPKSFILHAMEEDEEEGHPKFPSKNEWCFSFYLKDFKEILPRQKPWKKIDQETCIASRAQIGEMILLA